LQSSAGVIDTPPLGVKESKNSILKKGPQKP